jgi:cyclopropane fatty-acyl-phospholipid synthase-like methyltransferase
MTKNPKQIVSNGYDLCALAYNEARARDPSAELGMLIDVLPTGARVLEIGCGGGFPVTSALAHHASVVGVDLSAVQAEQARIRVPKAAIIHGDIMDQAFQPSFFDGVVSLYTLFHLPRERHRPLLERIAQWLSPGGHLLITVADSDHPGYTEDDFFGATMYWSHFGPKWYQTVLGDLGFSILHSDVVGHGYGNRSNLPAERHPLIFARLEDGGS